MGTPAGVFTAPGDGEVAAFVGVETVIAGKVASLQDGQVIVEADGFSLEAVGDIRLGRQVLFCLRPEDVTLVRIGVKSPSSARNRLNGALSRMTPRVRWCEWWWTAASSRGVDHTRFSQ